MYHSDTVGALASSQGIHSVSCHLSVFVAEFLDKDPGRRRVCVGEVDSFADPPLILEELPLGHVDDGDDIDSTKVGTRWLDASEHPDNNKARKRGMKDKQETWVKT